MLVCGNVCVDASMCMFYVIGLLYVCVCVRVSEGVSARMYICLFVVL